MIRLALPALALLASAGCTAWGLVLDADPDTDAPVETDDAPLVTAMSAWTGECWGMCIQEIRFDGGEVVFEGRNWDGALYVQHRATLTVEGLVRLRTVEADAAAAELLPVYGCPDCNDGGGVTVLRVHEAGVLQTDYPWGQPPEALAAADELFFDLLWALYDCAETELIVPSTECAVDYWEE